MSVVLHRVEALPGDGRYALTFHVSGGGEQSAVAQVDGGDVRVAAASLPPGWDLGSAHHAAAVRAVLALHEARITDRGDGTLVDVDGGWDVGLGNVLLGDAGLPECVAHGLMSDSGGGLWTCPECGARAAVS